MVERDGFESTIEIARQIVLNELEPYRGAAAIWAYLAEGEGEYPEPLRAFVGLASEWQDHPEHRAALEADIRAEAKRLIDAASPSGSGP